jgi:hypothetical protein
MDYGTEQWNSHAETHNETVCNENSYYDSQTLLKKATFLLRIFLHLYGRKDRSLRSPCSSGCEHRSF